MLLHASDKERHAARIAAKRLRYAAEFFAPLFPGKRTRTYLNALAKLQDVLGRLHDGTTAAMLASELGDGAAAGSVRAWVASRALTLDSGLAEAIRRIDAAKPFWARR
jgi:CHAD domain-containing protein